MEQQQNPALRGRPVGIIKDSGRGCIIASSNEAKQLGINTGTTVKEAQKIYPKIILIPADFNKYKHTTQKFINTINHYSPLTEVFSLDEMFLDAGVVKNIYPDPVKLARTIRAHLKNKLGEWVTVSTGISHNKLLAKLASEISPKNSILVINHHNRDQILSSINLTDICGIGHRLANKLNRLGITNLLQIRSLPNHILRASFGPHLGRHLKNLAWGQDFNPLIPLNQVPPAKSVGRTFTLYQDTTDPFKIRATIRNLTEEATFKLRKMSLMGRLFVLTLRGAGETKSGRTTLKHHTDQTIEVNPIIDRLYQSLDWHSPVRFVGIHIGLLENKHHLTKSLLFRVKKWQNIYQGIDSINQNFGYFTVYPASLHAKKLIRPEVTGFLGDKQFHFGNLERDSAY